MNASTSIPMGLTYSIVAPQSATMFLGTKRSHYTPFIETESVKQTTANGYTTYEYWLGSGQTYNFRVSQEGKLTQGGYFTASATFPTLEFTQDDLDAYDPKTVQHDVSMNGGYNVGNILLNINERGHLKMNSGDSHQMIAYRDWQLTDNSTNNYFINPDFHYTVINENGSPSSSVIKISEDGLITTVGKGTAIVLVTYDAISLNYYSGNNKSAYLGGPFWAAIWPENTGAFVVTVDDAQSGITSNMMINETFNAETLKLAGGYVEIGRAHV